MERAERRIAAFCEGRHVVGMNFVRDYAALPSPASATAAAAERGR